MRDIDLDLPYIKKDEDIRSTMARHSLSEAAAIRIDYEENWKQKRMLFRDQVRCIAGLYTFLLGRFPNDRSKKIMINCVESPGDGVQTTVDGFTEVSVKLDIDLYFSLSDFDKKTLILKKIDEGIIKVVNEYSWEHDVFNQITAEIKERNYVNQFVWKRKTSPDKKLIAEVFCEHDIEKFTATLIIKGNKSGDLVKVKEILQKKPHELIFVQYLGDLKWIADRTVAVTYRKQKAKWLVEEVK